MLSERIQWALDVLIKAYQEQTLTAGNCAACAVGNMLQAKGYDFEDNDFSGAWLHRLHNYRDIRTGLSPRDFRYDIGEKTLKLLPFSIEEINQIELRFEREALINRFIPNPSIGQMDNLRYNAIKAGLNAVAEYLISLDDVEVDLN